MGDSTIKKGRRRETDMDRRARIVDVLEPLATAMLGYYDMQEVAAISAAISLKRIADGGN